MSPVPGVFSLKGVVQHYAWGGYDFLPQLLGIDNSKHQPFAEYWMGAHPNHPAQVGEPAASLADLIISQGPALLGESVNNAFHSLPYLLKVLDVRQMLSIQVHPSKESAEAGYADEEGRGIDLKQPNRNYKDRNHKPELMAALSDFWLLHGFKPEAELTRILNETPELSSLLSVWERGSYRGLYEHVMYLPQDEVDRLLAPLAARIVPPYEAGGLDRSREDFWAARAVQSFCTNGHYNRGIFSIYFFNLLHLKKGEGIYQAAGLPHAYLEGQNVEVMANSDNVLRAGLTDKHIDVPELMKHVHFTATHPDIIAAGTGPHQVFRTPAREFELQRYTLAAGAEASFQASTAEILVAIEGAAELSVDGGALKLERGAAALVTAGREAKLSSNGGADVFRVTVPQG